MKKLTTFALLGAGLFAFAGCERKGPLEELGDDIEDAADDIGDDIEDALDD